MVFVLSCLSCCMPLGLARIFHRGDVQRASKGVAKALCLRSGEGAKRFPGKGVGVVHHEISGERVAVLGLTFVLVLGL